MHNYTDYGWLRGFSIVPSWGARIEEAWWNYDPAAFRAEIAPARHFHANTLRLWIEFTAWMAHPEDVTAAFLDAVAAIDEAGMKTMPCLFNRWHDRQFDYGGQYMENLQADIAPHFDYVAALVEPLATDDRILIWDLCNEPSTGNASQPLYEYYWLAAIRDVVLRSGAKQPVMIGTMYPGQIDLFAPIVDVLCCHPYLEELTAIERVMAELRVIRDKWSKPMLCNETGLGAVDGHERGEHTKLLFPILEQQGIGWMGWALRPGAAISTRLDRMDRNGLRHEGYHPWVEPDGSPRKGLEWLTDPPKRRAPWFAG